MAPRRPPVVKPEQIRDDIRTQPYRGRRGANKALRVGRTPKATEEPETLYVPARPVEKIKRDWPTLAQIYDWTPRYGLDETPG